MVQSFFSHCTLQHSARTALVYMFAMYCYNSVLKLEKPVLELNCYKLHAGGGRRIEEIDPHFALKLFMTPLTLLRCWMALQFLDPSRE